MNPYRRYMAEKSASDPSTWYTGPGAVMGGVLPHADAALNKDTATGAAIGAGVGALAGHALGQRAVKATRAAAVANAAAKVPGAGRYLPHAKLMAQSAISKIGPGRMALGLGVAGAALGAVPGVIHGLTQRYAELSGQ